MVETILVALPGIIIVSTAGSLERNGTIIVVINRPVFLIISFFHKWEQHPLWTQKLFLPIQAGPSYFFISNKFLYTIFLMNSRFFYHAHRVSGSISYIQMFHSIAGIHFTRKTELCFFFLQYFTVFDCTSYTGNGFIGIRSPATGTGIFFS